MIVVSANWFNTATASKLVVAVPLTSTDKPYLTHVLVTNEAGLRVDSWAMCEQIRAVSFERFKRKLGKVPDETLNEIRTVVARILRDAYETQ